MPTGNGFRLRLPEQRTAVAVASGYALLLGAAIAAQAYPLAVLPLAVGVVALALARRDLLLLGLVATVPLSLNLEQLEIGGVGLYLPTEPLLFGLLLLFLLDRLRGVQLDAGLEAHPITRSIQVMFVWLVITTLTSSDPLVSLKFVVARGWFVVGFFFLLVPLLSGDKKQERFILLYLIPLLAVILYTVVRHAGYGFEKQAGHWVMDPFFKDHTSYGAVLAMLLPPAIAMAWRTQQSTLSRVLWTLAVAWISLGTVLSFTRAAWVSLAAAGALWGLMMLGVRFRTLLVAGILGLVGLVFTWDALVIQLERNKQDSSDDLAQHVESISNVSSDDSNLERLNRWSCALAMFEERPVFGWGPGTYQFEYAPFQTSDLRTLISTNNGDVGNAHSEYLGPLSEQGLLGFLSVLALLLATGHLGFKLQRKLLDPDDRRLALGVFLGLVTYFVHGVLNNYLDTDKASAPFWGFLAMMVILDVQSSKTKV